MFIPRVGAPGAFRKPTLLEVEAMNNPRKNLLAPGLASAILAAAPAWVGA